MDWIDKAVWMGAGAVVLVLVVVLVGYLLAARYDYTERQRELKSQNEWNRRALLEMNNRVRELEGKR